MVKMCRVRSGRLVSQSWPITGEAEAAGGAMTPWANACDAAHPRMAMAIPVSFMSTSSE
jgi:hypothetical protein